MAGRGKLRVSMDQIRDEELLDVARVDRQYPLDSMQVWIDKLICEQREANNRWKQLAEISRNEQKRGNIQLRLLMGLKEAGQLHRVSQNILTREQQEELNMLEKRAQEIRCQAQASQQPLLAIEPAPHVKPMEAPPLVPPATLTLQSTTAGYTIKTPAAKKSYKLMASHDSSSSSGDDRLKINEDETPRKKKKTEKKESKSKGKERKTSTSSHHSAKQGRVGGRFSKKIESVVDTEVACSSTQQVQNIPAIDETPVIPRNLSIVLPRVSLSKCNFFLNLRLEPS